MVKFAQAMVKAALVPWRAHLENQVVSGKVPMSKYDELLREHYSKDATPPKAHVPRAKGEARVRNRGAKPAPANLESPQNAMQARMAERAGIERPPASSPWSQGAGRDTAWYRRWASGQAARHQKMHGNDVNVLLSKTNEPVTKDMIEVFRKPGNQQTRGGSRRKAKKLRHTVAKDWSKEVGTIGGSATAGHAEYTTNRGFGKHKLKSLLAQTGMTRQELEKATPERITHIHAVAKPTIHVGATEAISPADVIAEAKSRGKKFPLLDRARLAVGIRPRSKTMAIGLSNPRVTLSGLARATSSLGHEGAEIQSWRKSGTPLWGMVDRPDLVSTHHGWDVLENPKYGEASFTRNAPPQARAATEVVRNTLAGDAWKGFPFMQRAGRQIDPKARKAAIAEMSAKAARRSGKVGKFLALAASRLRLLRGV